MIEIKPKQKPKWFQIRKQVARFLVFLARKIEPKSDYLYSYYLEQMAKANMDAMTYGTAFVKIEHVPYEEVIK